jgi:hypothetical protein
MCEVVEKSLDEIAAVFQQSVGVEDRKYRLTTYKQSFIASEAVDYLIDAGYARSRQEAAVLGRSLQTSRRLFEHVCEGYLFNDGLLFFRFLDANKRTLLFKLDKISAALKENVRVEDINNRMTTYKQCFVGSEAVDYLVKAGFAHSRKAAVELGRSLQKDVRLFDHVLKDHKFADEPTYFRFLKEDEKLKQSLNWTNISTIGKGVIKVRLEVRHVLYVIHSLHFQLTCAARMPFCRSVQRVSLA